METIILNKIRVQLLSDDVVRVELAKGGAFCDDNTFFIPEREQYAENRVAHTLRDGVVYFGAYALYLPQGGATLSGLRLEKNGKRVYTYKKLANTGELPPLDKTPEVFAVSDTPRILIPRGGYSKDRAGQYRVTENVRDVYLLLAGGDAAKLRRLYVALTGRPELVRLSTLGGWNSKYYPYTEEEAKQLILDYEAHGVPLDNIVIDTDWRSCEHGWGYDINTKLFPNMKRFLDFAHAHGVDVMFNDHPEPVDDLHVFRSKEIAYRERSLQSLMKKGLDTWWYDRNWSASLISPSKNVRWETLGLYLFHDITKHFYQKQAGNDEIYRRPDIMGNVVHIDNGRYRAVTDSASHRYSVQWTGDIQSDIRALQQEVETLVRASANEIVYVNADCGGHLGNPDKETFIRWMQFGTLSPVFRPHCTNYVKRTREPWVFDEETLEIVRAYNHLRYRLLPIFYKSAHQAYETGLPICRALGFAYPDDRRALASTRTYMIGDNILVSPITEQHDHPLEASHYIAPVKATYYNGTKLDGEPVAETTYDRIHLHLHGGAPAENVPASHFSVRFETEIAFDRPTRLDLRCDDGATIRLDGEEIKTGFNCPWLSAASHQLATLEGGTTHRIVVEYFHTEGDAEVCLYGRELPADPRCDVYLPRGKWLDPFDGSIYRGGRHIKKAYGLREMPLFIRTGALIPLAHEAKNTKEQQWNDLVLDYYPDRETHDADYLYEDDTETTAYRLGQYAKTPYEAYFDPADGAYTVKLHATEGHFSGAKCFGSRHITLKLHLINGVQRVSRVTVNGDAAAFETKPREAGAFPLNVTDRAADGKTVLVTFTADAAHTYEIKFYE